MPPIGGRSWLQHALIFSAGAFLACLLFLVTATATVLCANDEEPKKTEKIFPGDDWARKTPEQAGLSAKVLDTLAKLVGGRGCVVWNGILVFSWGDIAKSGDIASAFKPILSFLLLRAVEEGRIDSVDAKVSEVKSELRELNSGKDAGIKWRHLASQTSGYGLQEFPGKAFAYNDYAVALYYDSLMLGVFKKDGTTVLKEQLGAVLGFQDRYTFEAFGPKERPGRLAVSVRDLARFGLLFQRGGRWRDKQILRPDLVKMALGSPLPVDLPRTAGKDAPMLPQQRTVGGGKNQTPIGPGYYSFNWWLNATDKDGRRLFVDLPSDSFAAMGHGGERALWVIPSLDLIVAWNDSDCADFDSSPGNSGTKINQAATLIRDSVLLTPK